MIRGEIRLSLTNDSVREALQEYLQKRMAPNIRMKLLSWNVEGYEVAAKAHVMFIQEQGDGAIQPA